MCFEFLLESNTDLLSIINEMGTSTHASVKLMFEHMIKYQANPIHQSSSWVKTILRCYCELLNSKELSEEEN